MRKSLLIICFLVFASHAGAKSNLSDTEIVQQIIRDSIASYPGNCPCPYNSTRNGSACGRRSAYSKPGGYSPICYPNDVSAAMIEKYRKKYGN
jgi:hypothetical protein